MYSIWCFINCHTRFIKESIPTNILWKRPELGLIQPACWRSVQGAFPHDVAGQHQLALLRHSGRWSLDSFLRRQVSDLKYICNSVFGEFRSWFCHQSGGRSLASVGNYCSHVVLRDKEVQWNSSLVGMFLKAFQLLDLTVVIISFVDQCCSQRLHRLNSSVVGPLVQFALFEQTTRTFSR